MLKHAVDYGIIVLGVLAIGYILFSAIVSIVDAADMDQCEKCGRLTESRNLDQSGICKSCMCNANHL